MNHFTIFSHYTNEFQPLEHRIVFITDTHAVDFGTLPTYEEAAAVCFEMNKAMGVFP